MAKRFQAESRALLDDLRKSQFSRGVERYEKLVALITLIRAEMVRVRREEK